MSVLDRVTTHTIRDRNILYTILNKIEIIFFKLESSGLNFFSFFFFLDIRRINLLDEV